MKEHVIEEMCEAISSSTSMKSLERIETAHGYEAEASKEGTLSGATADDSLWDSFWAEHGSRNRLFDWFLWRTRIIFSRRYAKLLLERWRSNPVQKDLEFRVLEIGCGSAMTSNFISRTSRESHNFAVDLSMEAIKIARDRNPELRCVVADALALPFADEIFSLSFSSGVIEHFNRSVAHKMHSEHWRITKVEDTVAVIVPWKHSPYNLFRILCGKRWPFGKENPFSIGELQTFVEKHPMREISVRTVYGTTLITIGIRDRTDEDSLSWR